MKALALIGGGGHARSIVGMMEGRGEVAGYVAESSSALMEPLAWLGTDEDFMARYQPGEIDVHIAVGFGRGGSLCLRRQLVEKYGDYGQPSLIAPSAWVGEKSEIGDGATVMTRAVVNGAHIGRWTVVNTGAIIEHDCHIGENCFIGPGAVICGGVTIADDVFVGAGAIVRQGVAISSGVVVGMGAVVVRDIVEPGVYAGNPAVKIK